MFVVFTSVAHSYFFFVRHLIIDFKPVTPGICTVSTREKFLNCSIVNGLAPTEILGDEKDGVFAALERAYDISPRNDIKIVLGDFNAQVGKSKGKAIPLQAWTGHECSRRLKLPDSKTVGT